MKPINYQSFLLPLNAIITAVIFFLLAPTTRIYASWFPEKEIKLWFFPVSVVLFSSILWIFGSLSTPFLIRSGIFQDRRCGPRPEVAAKRVQIFKIIFPVMNFLFHSLLLIAISASLMIWTRNHSSEEILKGISWNYVIR